MFRGESDDFAIKVSGGLTLVNPAWCIGGPNFEL